MANRTWQRKPPANARVVRRVPTIDGIKARTIRFTEHDLIVYKKPRNMTEDKFSKFLDAAAQDILARFGIDMIVVGVSTWDEIRLFTPEQLKELGLVKRDEVFLLKSDVTKMGVSGEEILAMLQQLNEEEE